MRLAWLLCAGLLAIAAPVHAQPADLSPAQRRDGEADVRKAATLLAARLKAAPTPRFRRVFLQKTFGEDAQEYVTVCGEVDASNTAPTTQAFHKFMLLGDQIVLGGDGAALDADVLCATGTPRVDGRDYTAELEAAFRAGR